MPRGDAMEFTLRSFGHPCRMRSGRHVGVGGGTGLLYFEVRRADTFIGGDERMIAPVIIGLRMVDCAKAAASRRTPHDDAWLRRSRLPAWRCDGVYAEVLRASLSDALRMTRGGRRGGLRYFKWRR